jgi:hypothetical protein
MREKTAKGTKDGLTMSKWDNQRTYSTRATFRYSLLTLFASAQHQTKQFNRPFSGSFLVFAS